VIVDFCLRWFIGGGGGDCVRTRRDGSVWLFIPIQTCCGWTCAYAPSYLIGVGDGVVLDELPRLRLVDGAHLFGLLMT
jgi:hypothetical protein